MPPADLKLLWCLTTGNLDLLQTLTLSGLVTASFKSATHFFLFKTYNVILTLTRVLLFLLSLISAVNLISYNPYWFLFRSQLINVNEYWHCVKKVSKYGPEINFVFGQIKLIKRWLGAEGLDILKISVKLPRSYRLER